MTDMTTPEHAGDRAMGLELEAIDLEVQRKLAESQGRADDVTKLAQELSTVYEDLAQVSESIPAEEPPADTATIDAPRGAD